MAATTEIRVSPVQKVAWDFTFAFLLLRLWLGFRALFVGVQKFAAYKAVATPLIDPSTGQPDASGVMVNVNVKSYALANYAGIPVGLRDKFAHDPLFPKFALTLFDRSWTGIHSDRDHAHRWIGHTGLIAYTGIALHRPDVGLVLIDANDGVAYLGIHIGLVAAAFLLVQHNRFAVLKKW